MGIRLIVEAMDHAPATLSHREWRLLVVLAEDANDDTWITWGSVAAPKVLRRAKLSRTQLYEVIKSLVAQGALEKVAAGQKNGTAKYRLLPQCPVQRDSGDPSQCPDPQDTERPQRPVHRDTDGRFSVPETGTLTDSQSPEDRDTDDSQCPVQRDVSVPPSGTPTPHPLERDISPAPSATPDAAAPFEEFWRAYPLKVAEGIARLAFAAAVRDGADPARIIAAVPRHRAHWQALGRKPEFIPHAATWLRAESWNDVLNTPTPPPPPPRTYDPAERGVF